MGNYGCHRQRHGGHLCCRRATSQQPVTATRTSFVLGISCDLVDDDGAAPPVNDGGRAAQYRNARFIVAVSPRFLISPGRSRCRHPDRLFAQDRRAVVPARGVLRQRHRRRRRRSVTLLLQVPFFFISGFTVRFVTALRANRIMFWGTVISAAVNVIGNYVFMIWFGVVGIALSTAFVYAISTAYLLFMTTRLIYSRQGEAP